MMVLHLMLGPRVWIESKKNKQFIIYSGLLAHDGAPFDARTQGLDRKQKE
jgi:hypothetical protein